MKPKFAVDLCGENGKSHSYVFDAPFFKQQVSFQMGELVFREYKALKEQTRFVQQQSHQSDFISAT